MRQFGFDDGHANPSAAIPPAVHVVDGCPDGRALLGSVASEVGLSVRHYASGEEFLSGTPGQGALLCDIRLPGLSGLELQRRLRTAAIPLPIVFVSEANNVSDAVLAMRGGAVTVLAKPCTREVVREALAEALEAGRVQQERESRRRTAATRFASLAAEEAAVLDMLMDGLPNKTAAARLGVGLRTVERRRATALRILGVDSLVAAALLRAELAGRLDPRPRPDDPLNEPPPQGRPHTGSSPSWSSRARIEPANS